MWNDFKAMPLLLRFLTGHALACFFFLVGSVVPHDSFQIDGRHVTYAEWWQSGYAAFASAVGVVGPVVAIMLLKRTRAARMAYLGFLVSAMIVPYPVMGEPLSAIPGAIAVALLALYLYRRQSVRAYFAS